MARPKVVTISGPFDVRHVAGVGIPGTTLPIAGGAQRSYSSGPSLEPDEIPTHSFVATGTTEIQKPKRANTIASSLSRPSLRLKTSISRLRGRSSSSSPDTKRKSEQDSALEENKEGDMSTQSLRMKPSMPRLRGRTTSNSPDTQRRREQDNSPEADKESDMFARSLRMKPSMSKLREKLRAASNPPDQTREPETEVAPPTLEKDVPPIPLKTPISPSTSRSTTNPTESSSYSFYQPQKEAPAPPQPNSILQKRLPATRPKRADSGTAIDFNDVPAEERPLGFKEIMRIGSLEERLALYKKTREYWASADHGLGEWVDKTGRRRPLVFQV